jgi:hypothetical protein
LITLIDTIKAVDNNSVNVAKETMGVFQYLR